MGRRALLAGLSGALLAFAMPGPDLGPFAAVALVPLLCALHGQSPKTSFRIGLIGGTAFFGILLHWLHTLWDFASIGIVPAYLVLVGYLALYWGLFGWGYAWLSRRLGPWALALAAASLWTVLEWIRAQGPFGFPWGQAADALYQMPTAIQVSSIAGIWGVTFLLVLVNALLAEGWARRRWPEPVVALVVVGLTLGGGWLTLAQSGPSSEGMDVRIVQPSIPQGVRSDASRLAEFRSIYRDLMSQIEASESELTILPESILPTYVLDDADVRAELTDWAQEHDQTLLFGTYTRAEGATHNSSVAVSSDGTVADTYHKNHLVPFSTEYFPGKPLLRQLGVFNLIPVGNRLGLIDPGQRHGSLRTDIGRIATPICFESIFPRIGRAFVQNGADLIVIITNDAWFKASSALPQHFSKAVFRAVETRRYVVQAANSGISGIVDAQGRIQARSGINERTVLGGTVRSHDRETRYVRWGDWLIGLNAFYLGLIPLWLSLSSRFSRRLRPD